MTDVQTDENAVRQDVLSRALIHVAAQKVTILQTYPKGEPFPRLRGMGFANQNWTFYISTRLATLKAKEIITNPHVTLLFTDSAVRPDHFIQVDADAHVIRDKERARWQEVRYAKEGDFLRQAFEQMDDNEWVGWALVPVRLRILGYVSDGKWGRSPLVYDRSSLGAASGSMSHPE
jgi:general stress protein 26